MAGHEILKKLRIRVLMALWMLVLALPGSAADVDWPQGSIGEVSVFAVAEGIRQQAAYCSGEMPDLKGGFTAAVAALEPRIRQTGLTLLDSEPFRSLNSRAAPGFLYELFAATLNESLQEYAEHDPEDLCTQTLENLRGMDDEVIRASLRLALTGVMNALRTQEDNRP